MFFNPQEFRFMKHQQQPHIKSHKRTPSGTVHVTADTGVKIKMSPPKNVLQLVLHLKEQCRINLGF